VAGGGRDGRGLGGGGAVGDVEAGGRETATNSRFDILFHASGPSGLHGGGFLLRRVTATSTEGKKGRNIRNHSIPAQPGFDVLMFIQYA